MSDFQVVLLALAVMCLIRDFGLGSRLGVLHDGNKFEPLPLVWHAIHAIRGWC